MKYQMAIGMGYFKLLYQIHNKIWAKISSLESRQIHDKMWDRIYSHKSQQIHDKKWVNVREQRPLENPLLQIFLPGVFMKNSFIISR